MTPIALGADHAGYALKEVIKAYLNEQGISVKDYGCFNGEPVDYPLIAGAVAQVVDSQEFQRGILCCGSGIGVAIAANRYPGVRAAVCHDFFAAEMSRRHNDSNIICMGGRVVAEAMALEILKIWLATEFEAGRHQDRVNQMGMGVPAC